MTTPCFEFDALDEVRRLETSDPRRQHLDQCPRCQARWMVYQEFLEDRSTAPGVDLEDAAARLGAAFEKRAGRGERAGRERSGRRWAELAKLIRTGTLRPVWATAAVLLVVASVYLGLGRPGGGDAPDVLRGVPGESAAEFRGKIHALPVEYTAGGGAVLRWRAVPEAESYVVRFFGPDLADVAKMGPIPDTLLALPAGAFPAESTPGQVVGWQVVALRGGQPLAASASGTLRIR